MLRSNMEDVVTVKTAWVHHTADTNLLPLTVTCYGDVKCGPLHYTERDCSASCMIIFTIRGEGILTYKKVRRELTPNSLVMLDCNKYHYFMTSPAKGEWHYCYVHFYGELPRRIESFLNTDGAFAGSVDQKAFYESFEALMEFERSRSPIADIRASSILFELLSSLVQQKYGAIKKDEAPEWIGHSLSYINEHFREDISIDYLAGNAAVSKYYLIKSFRLHVGVTPYQYILKKRVEHARMLLASTGLSISEIAAASGFSDSKQLIYSFKNALNMTPSAYRRCFF